MKSKIEEKIKNAREATNEMFAAFDELNERLKEKEPEKWLPKVGEYYHTTVRLTGTEYIGICEDVIEDFVIERVSLRVKDSELLFHYVISIDCWNFRPATPEEIALLDSKLAEQGKRFDKEKLELVDIPKHKRPIVGEMAIMWRSDKGKALCRIYGDYEDGRHYDSVGIWADNAILFESPEQYKDFLKS